MSPTMLATQQNFFSMRRRSNCGWMFFLLQLITVLLDLTELVGHKPRTCGSPTQDLCVTNPGPVGYKPRTCGLQTQDLWATSPGLVGYTQAQNLLVCLLVQSSNYWTKTTPQLYPILSVLYTSTNRAQC